MTTAGNGPDAGWYDDPADPTMARYWDGEQWTSRVRPKSAPSTAEGPPSYGAAPSYAASAGGPAATHGAAPPNYLPQAILTTLFCCLPFGIVAIVKASQVNGLWQSGQADAAAKASADAKRWTWIAFGIGLAVVALWIVLGAAGALFDDTSSY